MNRGVEIGFDSNFLTVNGQKLRADVLPSQSKDKLIVSSAELQEILASSRGRILSEMESIYRANKRPGLTVSRPSLFTVHLGMEHQSEGSGNKVFTELGQKNGGVITEADEIDASFHEYFAMVGDAGFVPEVRRTAGARVNRGSWLSLRKPTLWEVADGWLGYNGSVGHLLDEDHVLRRDLKDLKPEEIDNDMVLLYRRLGERAVDTLSDISGDNMRSHYQIGLILSLAALKQTMGDHEGYVEEAQDALTYADNDPTVHDSAVRAIENCVYGTY